MSLALKYGGGSMALESILRDPHLDGIKQRIIEQAKKLDPELRQIVELIILADSRTVKLSNLNGYLFLADYFKMLEIVGWLYVVACMKGKNDVAENLTMLMPVVDKISFEAATMGLDGHLMKSLTTVIRISEVRQAYGRERGGPALEIPFERRPAGGGGGEGIVGRMRRMFAPPGGEK